MRRLGSAAVLQALDEAAALTFMLLTGYRPGEALKVRWPAIDLGTRTWHLPASAAAAVGVALVDHLVLGASGAGCRSRRRADCSPEDGITGAGVTGPAAARGV